MSGWDDESMDSKKELTFTKDTRIHEVVTLEEILH
jgi:hypothetical protein